MDTLLLIVTGASLVAALFLGWTAWRLARAERERELARIAALAAAVADASAATPADPQPRVETPRAEPPSQWAVARPRASTRMAAVRPVTEEIVWAPPRPEELPLRTEPAIVPAMHDAFLGSTAPVSSGGQRTLAIVAVVLLFVLGAVGAWFYSGPASTAVVASAPTQTPLELISLQHVREGERISVSGLVRNPAAGQTVERLQATVLLFDQQGGYLTSTRSFVDLPHLSPGEESPFTLSMPAPTAATRYRVSFRTEERIVPHVDRRETAPAAQGTAQPATAAAR